MLSKVKFSKTWIKLVYLWVCFAKFFLGGGIEGLRKETNLDFGKKSISTRSPNNCQKTWFLSFQWIFERLFFVISPRLIMRALVKSCQSSRSNFHPKTEIKGKKSKKSEAYYHLWAWWELFSVQFLCWFVLFSKGKDKP